MRAASPVSQKDTLRTLRQHRPFLLKEVSASGSGQRAPLCTKKARDFSPYRTPKIPGNSPFFARQKKGFSFFSCGATPSRTVPKTQPLEVAFSLLERVDLRSQKDRILGKKIAWGRVGWTGQKKEKRMHKKRWGKEGKNANPPKNKEFLAEGKKKQGIPKKQGKEGRAGRGMGREGICGEFAKGGGVGARNRYHLSFWRFFPQFYSTFWPNSGAIHVARPVVVLWRFPLF